MNESPENYRCLIFCCLYISFVPDNSRTLFPYFSLYVKKKLRLCALCYYGNQRKRETVYVFQKLSAYILWILTTKPEQEQHFLDLPCLT